jgi:hypothetical protein
MAFTDFYQGLDETLPDDVIFAALDNIDPTFEPNVSAVYGKVKSSRECWPIPWFESDGGGTRRDQWGPQPNVHAFAPLLEDAQRKGCRGFLGIHWRTRAIEEVAGYAFRRAWEPDLTPDAFFARLASAAYGPEAATELAAVHRRLEEMGPRWTGAMGQVECGSFTWFSQEGHELPEPGAVPPYRAGSLPAEERFRELGEIEQRLVAWSERWDPDRRQEDAATGSSAVERVHYLLRTLRWLVAYDRAALQLWEGGAVEAVLRKGEAAVAGGDPVAAQEAGLQAIELLQSCGLAEAVQTLAENVTNQGELGVLATVNGKAVAAFRQLIRRAEILAGTSASSDLLAARGWPRQLRIWAWSPGEVVEAGQGLTVEVRALGPRPVQRVQILYRPFGAQDPAWHTVGCSHVRNGVYRGTIPAAAMPAAGIEYGVRAEDDRISVTAPHGFPSAVFSALTVESDAMA